ncbi:MAG: haloacid dehalogenase-like hydrolase [Candidatus Altarchaeaceae archaeon]
MNVYVFDFHETLTEGYELEYNFYKALLKNKNLSIKAELLLKLIGMYINKKKDSVNDVFDILEECLNLQNVSNEDVENAIKISTEKFSLNKELEEIFEKINEKFILTRGIENIIKEALKKYNIEVYGNKLYYEGKWKVNREIMSPEDKLKKLKEILNEKYKGKNIKTIVLGNGNADIEILKFADVPVATYNATKKIKNIVKKRNGIILKKNNFYELLNV